MTSLDRTRLGSVPSAVLPSWTASGVPCHNAPTADDYVQRAASADPTLLIAYVSQGDLYLTDGAWTDVYQRDCLIVFDGWAPNAKRFMFEKHVYECDPAFDQGDVDEPADADSVELFIGRPCMIAVGVLPSQYASAGRWLDDDHFVYRTQSTYGGGADTRWQMRVVEQ